jgi:hypothetical protein
MSRACSKKAERICQVASSKRVRPDFAPDARVHRDVRETLGDLPNVFPEPRVSASVLSTFGDAMASGAENGDEAVFQLDRGAELLAHLVQANLGNVGPNAQNIGNVGDVERHSNTT